MAADGGGDLGQVHVLEHHQVVVGALGCVAVVGAVDGAFLLVEGAVVVDHHHQVDVVS